MSRPTRFVLLGIGVVAAVALGLVVTMVAMSALGPSAPSRALAAPRYVSEATSAGIDHVYDGESHFFEGGGVAAFDCDANGSPDLYLAGGSNPAALYRNQSPVGGALRFEALPDAVTDLTDVTGAYPLDIDGDGITDLAVLRVGENVLLRGLGDCRFERANESWGFDGGNEWTDAFSASWEDQRSLPTLAIGNYLALDATGKATGDCADSQLVRPQGATYGAPAPLSPGYCTLSILFSDWDRNGERDLRVTNDRHYYRDGSDQLWHIAPGEAPRQYSAADGWQPLQIWGMGIASQDLTGDGKPEVFLTSQGDNKLQTLVDGATGPDYRDIALRRGATAHRPFSGDDTLPSTAWHPEFEDVNNDGYMDLFISKGNVEAMPDYAVKDPSNLLIGQADGTFVEGAEAAGILSYARGRGAALVDFNLDGLLDIIEVNRRENVSLWRNVGTGDGTSDTAPTAGMGHWLGLRLEAPGANRDAIGAWIEVKAGSRTVTRELTVGGGHAGGQLGWTHFGLGDADKAEVRVHWPDGGTGAWQAVDADQFVILSRDGKVKPWSPTPP